MHERREPLRDEETAAIPSTLDLSGAIPEGAPAAKEWESPSKDSASPSFGDKLAGFATKAAMIAGGAVVAPVALAAMGVSAAYDSVLKKEPQGSTAGSIVCHEEYGSKSESTYQFIADVDTMDEEEETRLEKEPYTVESDEYAILEEERPLPSPTKIEETASEEGRVETHVERMTAAPESQLVLEGELAVYRTVPGEPGPHIIESSDYATGQEERPLSSPTKMEQPTPGEDRVEAEVEPITAAPESHLVLEEEHAVYTPAAEEPEPHIIESDEYEVQQEERPLSSPTKTEQPTLEEDRVETHAESITAAPESQLVLEGEHVTYTAAAEEPHIIESDEYSVHQEEGPLSSPTKIEQHTFEEDRDLVDTHFESMTTAPESQPLVLEGEHAVYSPEGEEPQPHIIESGDYAVEEEEGPLSSPAKMDQISPKEYREEIHTENITLTPDSHAQLEEHVIPTVGEEPHVIESEDYEQLQEEQPLSSPTCESQQIDTVKDSDDSAACRLTTQPSLHLLEEEALENVVKMRFSDTVELESPEKQSAHTPSSYPDEQHSIAGDDEWKVYDNKGEVLEDFSSQLTQELIQEAESNASLQSVQSPQKISKQESYSDVAMEHEVDYHSDLQEKLDILAGERREKVPSVQEEDQLGVIDETDYEHEADEEHEIGRAASQLVDEVINAAMEPHEDAKTLTSTSESNVYHTATEHSKDDQYDTCVTSQDTYDSAQEWTSQESEYTTAASGATSRLSEAEERQGSVTPLAILSPVDSDRQFTANQDFEDTVPVIRHFTVDDTARSTPDVPLQVTIEEEEEESEATIATSASGVLLAPHMDPGRPVSPVPPTRQTEEDEDYFVFVERPDEKTATKTSEEKSAERRSAETESTSDSQYDKSYSRQLSDMSSGSHADTVIHGKGDIEAVADVEDLTSAYEPASGSTDSLDKLSVKSGPAEKRDTTSQRSSASPAKTSDESEEHVEKGQAMESPSSSDDSAKERTSDTEEGFVICPPMEETPMVEGELETVEEEPEDVDSINGSGNSSVGVPSDTLALVGKYKHVSSDNVSLTSLQEFERLEQVVINRGEASLSASEIELYAAGKLRCSGGGSGEGSVSSLAEFEKLEQELTANLSPQEEVAMLPEIREESEVEDMSVRDDDEDDHSETEVKTRPIDEEDLRAATPIASPVDSLEREPIAAAIPLLETSTDSLEPSYERVEARTQRDSEASSLAEYEVSEEISSELKM
ncbi:hypothetical protein ANCDUO_17080 [Ancylostoma duodenale]|uniref:Uncharacterized protein n=1 Tax=Ancylostoma duodenale TaxID=51022 RepID=A0A0C2FW54_9BILA|nr:hypothetical protein ANCDUO_17080 [Ancylostoma duodenale]